MANAVSSFPLLRLPEKALTKTLQCMTAIDRLGVSFCSTRSKQAVVNLNLKADSVSLVVESFIEITFYFQPNSSLELKISPENMRSGNLKNASVPHNVNFHYESFKSNDFVEFTDNLLEERDHQHDPDSDFDDDESEGSEDEEDEREEENQGNNLMEDTDSDGDEEDLNEQEEYRRVASPDNTEDEREEEENNEVMSESDEVDDEEDEDEQESEEESEVADDEDEEVDEAPNHYFPVLRAMDHTPVPLQDFEWNLSVIDVRTLIDHCFEVYHMSQISAFYVWNGCEQLDFEVIRETIKGYNILQFEVRTESYAFARDMMNLQIPAKRLEINVLCFENTLSLHKTLIQNHDVISLNEPLVRNHTLIADDLLLINSAFVEIHDAMISNKELNKFMKHWIQGSNRRMKHIILRKIGDAGFNKDTIFKGISHEEFPEGVVRECKVLTGGAFATVKIASGFNFFREDHTEATIRIKNRRGRAALEFIVWD
ncbi:hypothetical protein CRE_01193 [Caenorhabditis remanei]|uniref:F-box domain-containing protein n=1 Tax=Caenorhabditis remanei TaxID=31234 RepID=E3MWH6_CAERE|nr:hypothetical protein CRE_01193 [Caenorhabditis remanei]